MVERFALDDRAHSAPDSVGRFAAEVEVQCGLHGPIAALTLRPVHRSRVRHDRYAGAFLAECGLDMSKGVMVIEGHS